MQRISWRGEEKGKRIYYLEGQIAKWPHPWKVTPLYAGEEKGWVCSVRPGFVNGVTPLVTLLNEEGESEDVPLWDDVEVPLGGLRRKESAIPEFFADLGVKDLRKEEAESLNINDIGGVTVNVNELEEAGDRSGDRVLWWTQIFLSMARATVALDVDLPGNIITGQIVEYTVRYDMNRLIQAGSRARLRVGEMPVQNEVASALERMQGNVGDEGEDYLLVATVYLLSPPLGKDEVVEGGAAKTPDGSWQGYVAHEQFWNLNHAALNEMPKNLNQDGLDPALAIFVGRYVAPGAITGAGAASTDSIMTALMNQSDNKGVWWST